MYVCMYVCMYVSFVRSYVRTYVRTYVGRYVCMYVCFRESQYQYASAPELEVAILLLQTVVGARLRCGCGEGNCWI